MALFAQGLRWTTQRFLDSYHAQRYDIPEADVRECLPTDRTRYDSLEVDYTMSQTSTTHQGKGEGFGKPSFGDYQYMLIRSDMEEDNPRSQQLPSMPPNEFGVRQRTKVLANYQIKSDDIEDKYNGPWLWVDSQIFHIISGAVIFTNAIVIGLETDISTPLWVWIEQAFLLFFCFELFSRVCRYGLVFFVHKDDRVWNWFDFFIVMFGVIDQWVVPLLETLADESSEGEGGSRFAVFFMLMRMARLLRIVRLFRLVRMVRPLYELAQGVLEALQGMFWVLVLMVMTLYTAGVVCNQIIAHGDIFNKDVSHDKKVMEIREMFTSLTSSMFALFGTMSSWSLLKLNPLFEELPLLKPCFVVFYIYSAWALLAVMTGVVSENMVAIRDQLLREEEMKEEIRRTMITDTILELFKNADADGSGNVSREEFRTMLRNEDIIKKLARYTQMQMQDLGDLFDWIDHDGSGTITIDEFMTGFKWILEPLRAKSLVQLQERIAGDLKQLESRIVQAIEAKYAEVQMLMAQPLRKVHAITEQMQSLEDHFGELRRDLGEPAPGTPTPQEIAEVEQRLSAKLLLVFDRLEAVEARARAAARARAQERASAELVQRRRSSKSSMSSRISQRVSGLRRPSLTRSGPQPLVPV